MAYVEMLARDATTVAEHGRRRATLAAEGHEPRMGYLGQRSSYSNATWSLAWPSPSIAQHCLTPSIAIMYGAALRCGWVWWPSVALRKDLIFLTSS